MSRDRASASRRLTVPSVAGPDAGGLLEGLEAPAVDGGFDGAEDGALDGGGGHDLPPAPLRLTGLGRVVLVGDPLPQLLEQRSGHEAAEDADEEADRPVQGLEHEHRTTPGSFRR